MNGSTRAPTATFLDIRKSDSERLRVTVSEYRGRTFIDLRVWYSIESGDYKPGRAGVSLRPDQIAEVVQGLLVASRALDPNGAN
ncbi:transcriptional coactivator p15/PC4 family protein [Paraburkholderia sp. MMS20-SJTR3]|uniref:Transcriptional coactivator p15/PC4 family protein n=1 Tax=Paraburkholderia sejongensis TaxID=2886946 RepID=A0ABS8K326_9BURK|nr:transcriptional coactivator p15/PC4 family protein [Paraburkholderia sp. MMS20-SJTR3]MCC8396313.1 transcriptional coactivator p15/PC4 family protein [Paraburkholderia sp. MMS20-SJTR3]